MRQPWVIANWKMHGDKAGVESLLKGFCANIRVGSTVAVCPPVVYLDQASQLLNNSVIKLGAQSASEHTQGAFTGEVSVPMLKEVGCSCVLVGHSERRTLFGETDQQIAAKFVAVGDQGLIPVLCVGESDQERTQGLTDGVVLGQLDAVIELAGIESFANAIVAYEPVWAIGTGKTATPDQAQAVHQVIRQRIAQESRAIADELPILYGGSVKAGNADEIFAMPDIDGGLVGGASLDIDEFSAICAAAG